jgi:hypothetical protein
MTLDVSEHIFYSIGKRHIGGEGRAYETGIPPAPSSGVVALFRTIEDTRRSAQRGPRSAPGGASSCQPGVSTPGFDAPPHPPRAQPYPKPNRRRSGTLRPVRPRLGMYPSVVAKGLRALPWPPAKFRQYPDRS